MDRYIGIPFVRSGRDIQRDKGLDCYGLACLYYRNEFNIYLPDHTHINTSEHSYQECANSMIQQSTYEDFQQVSTLKKGDLLLYNVGGFPSHIGIYIGDDLMLHTNERSGSVIEHYRSIKWKNKFQSGYRHKSLM